MSIPSDMTPRKAAQTLGIRLDAVYALIWAGKLPGHKADGRWQIPAKAVNERLRAQVERRQQTISSMPSEARER